MLKPARAKSCTVASCSDPLGIRVEASWNGHALRALEKAGALARVADVAAAEALGLDEHGVLIAVDEHLAHRELVARGLALAPQRVARAAVERHITGALRDVPRVLVHEADHQHFAADVVLHDRWYQSVQLRKVHVPLDEPRRHGGPREGPFFNPVFFVPPWFVATFGTTKNPATLTGGVCIRVLVYVCGSSVPYARSPAGRPRWPW